MVTPPKKSKDTVDWSKVKRKEAKSKDNNDAMLIAKYDEENKTLKDVNKQLWELVEKLKKWNLEIAKFKLNNT